MINFKDIKINNKEERKYKYELYKVIHSKILYFALIAIIDKIINIIQN